MEKLKDFKEYDYNRRLQDEHIKKLEEKIDDLNCKIDTVLDLKFKVNIMWAMTGGLAATVSLFLINKLLKILSTIK